MASTTPSETPAEPHVLSDFRLDTVLNCDPTTNQVICLATHNTDPSSPRALVFLKKAAFDVQHISDFFQQPSSSESEIKLDNVLQRNDKYFNFLASCPAKLNPLFVKLIYPASEADIKKYTYIPPKLLRETPEIYETITKHFIETKVTESELKWVYQILDKQAEQDRVLYQEEDPQTGFVIVLDTKWDEQNMDQLYVLAIAENRSLHSVRDLRAEHIPMLRKIKTVAAAQIKTKYGIDEDQLLFHIHYLPSFFQFHVHIRTIGQMVNSVPRTILLDDVIDNLTRDSEYYTKCSFSLILQNTHDIFVRLAAQQ